jgi:ADP-heptose:LPS heptosyltransferase
MADNWGKVSPISFPQSQELQPRILIIAIRAIGDVVLITPLISLLKKSYPTGYVAVLVDGPTTEVLANNPSIDRLIPINRSEAQRETFWKRGQNWVHLIRDIRNERFDVVIDVFSGPRSAMLSYLSGASERYGEDFRSRGRGFLYNHPIEISRDGRHLIEQKLDLVKALLGEKGLQVGKLELFLAKKERQQGRHLLGETAHGQMRRIGLIPNAGSIWRVWPAERFAALADCLIQKFGVEVILLGGGNDVEVCSKICSLMKEKPRDLSGKTTLRELMAVLVELDLVISNVTGPMHLAVGLSQPKVIGLYGAADTVQYAPWGTYGTMLTKGSTQDAYWDKVDYRQDYEILCQITVEDVLHTVQSVMTEWSACH